MEEAYIECGEAERDEYLYTLLSRHPGRTLVFVNAISSVRRLGAILKMLGLPAHPLHAGELVMFALTSSLRNSFSKHSHTYFRADALRALLETNPESAGPPGAPVAQVSSLLCYCSYGMGLDAVNAVSSVRRHPEGDGPACAIKCHRPQPKPRGPPLIASHLSPQACSSACGWRRWDRFKTDPNTVLLAASDGAPAPALPPAGMQQRARLKALDRFKTDPHAILVATDVAARGLDVKDVRWVCCWP